MNHRLRAGAAKAVSCLGLAILLAALALPARAAAMDIAVAVADLLGDIIVYCRSEALKAFGHAEVYVERLIPRARHIEVQVLGDNYGKIAAAVAIGLPLVVYLAQDSLIFYRQPLPDARRGVPACAPRPPRAPR